MAHLKYWLWLAGRPGLSNQNCLRLLEAFATPEELYWADTEAYARAERLTRQQLAALEDKALEPAQEILDICRRQDIRILTLQDADYPARLANIYDPPSVLYCKGRMPAFDEEAAIGVVGTRDCSPYGVSCSEKLGYGLAKQGALVVSGLAKGIDGAALRAALRAGGTVAAVLGGGVDVVYPPENRALYEDVVQAGVLLSEYPPGTPAMGKHFPVRNRILSGLCVATVVVEALEKSGALITAQYALEQGRDVYAVPGPIDGANSWGCNALIRDGAGLVTDSWDILRDYAPRFPHKLRPRHAPPPVLQEPPAAKPARPVCGPEPALPVLDLRGSYQGLTDDQILLLQHLGQEPIFFDDLLDLTELPTQRALSALTMLEIDGHMEQHPGKAFTSRVRLLQ